MKIMFKYLILMLMAVTVSQAFGRIISDESDTRYRRRYFPVRGYYDENGRYVRAGVVGTTADVAEDTGEFAGDVTRDSVDFAEDVTGDVVGGIFGR